MIFFIARKLSKCSQIVKNNILQNKGNNIINLDVVIGMWYEFEQKN
jgi:hypothetical protein